MAAPCSRMVSRTLWQCITNVGRTGLKLTGNRQLSLSHACRAATQTKSNPESVVSPWKLHGAVCLHRLPVISQDRNQIEDQFAELMHQMELERSLLSEHEQRLLEDAERMSRKQAHNYDSDEEEAGYGGQETITAQDQEDTWEHNLKHFQPAVRAREADFKATFLGNTPCGVYKYKFPKDVRTERCMGTKVFFFKALLSGGSCSKSASQKGTFLWVKKTELQGYLKPAYLEKVNRFILNL